MASMLGNRLSVLSATLIRYEGVLANVDVEKETISACFARPLSPRRQNVLPSFSTTRQAARPATHHNPCCPPARPHARPFPPTPSLPLPSRQR